MHEASLDWAVGAALRGVANGGSPSPALVSLLLRAYTLHSYAQRRALDVRGALENALTQGLDLVSREPDPAAQCEWLRVFDLAESISGDERFAATKRASIASAIDGLERTVSSRYEPGEGLEGLGVDQHLRCALALLAAFDITGRLPYSMLAEELVQVARRRWFDSARATFDGDFEIDCRATQLLCRLAALHEDPVYSETVLVARPLTYRTDAERMLKTLEPDHRDHEPAAVNFGLALVDWLALAQDLH
jgi:hypothetical protein